MEFLLDPGQLADFLSTSLRLAVPIAFAALGGVFAERSGVFNIGLEGMMLAGAFGAALGAFAFASPYGGLLTGAALGGLGGLLLAVLAVSLGGNQIVCGIAINLLSLGLTAFLARQIFGLDATTMRLPGFFPVALPLLADIPILGPVLFAQDPLVYALGLIVPALWWLMFRTSWGLAVRAVGESPSAADAGGLNVFALRYLCVVGSGVLAGIGGSYLVLSQVHLFTEHMTAGKGFIALAALILGRWNPVGALAASLFFGLCDALQLRLQFANPQVPYQIFVIVPYAASILALIGFYGRVQPPAAVGRPYRREARE
ncbi:MAG: ABC transporter permease [Geminicoccaceae bacterium]